MAKLTQIDEFNVRSADAIKAEQDLKQVFNFAKLTDVPGHRERAAHRFLFVDSPMELLGTDKAASLKALQRIAETPGELIQIPSRANRRLHGQVSYWGANPPSPYLFAAAVHRHVHGTGSIIEFGAGEYPSTAPLELMAEPGRKALLAYLPHPDALELRLRSYDGPNLDLMSARAAIIPFPIPQPDLWSLYQHIDLIRLRKVHDRPWLAKTLESLKGEVEFALSTGEQTFPKACEQRLAAVASVIPDSVEAVILSAPVVRGSDKVVFQAAKRLGWRCIDQYLAVAAKDAQGHGMRHYGNGTPILGEQVTAWAPRS